MLGRKRTRVLDQDDLIEVATGILRAEGLLAVTPERVAKTFGVSPLDVTASADLDLVLAEAYRRICVGELAEVKRGILANPSPAEQMRALLSWLSTAPQDGDAIRLEAWALTKRNPALRTVAQESEAAWHGLVASVIRRGARSGHFHEADAEEIAAHIISLVDGINTYELIGYRSDLDRMRLLTRVVQAELGLAWGPALATALS